MAYRVSALSKLIEQFERLPGIGRKTAQRLALHVLKLSEREIKDFSETLVLAHTTVKQCEVCRNLTDLERCHICDSEERDKGTICVVEDPRDLIAFERSGDYKGVYHVLHGLISPIDGIGPDQIYVKELLKRVTDGETEEIIMATNPTVEGEATAIYISKLLKTFGVKVTRLAYGIPVGADLEFADDVTLSRAIEGRREM